MANQAATVEYLPLGVVGVIGPWNYPVFTPMGSIAYALAAGNAVVFKPSELTPGVGQWLADAFREVVHGRDVLQVVTGLGETGAALCRARIDKLAFTGSAATGKKVMAACAENLTPVVIEAGGKDALIVDEDADIAAAADAALWGGMRQRRPDLHRRRARLRPRAGLRRVHDRDPRPGQGTARRGRLRARRSARSRCPSSSTSSRATSTTRIARGGRASCSAGPTPWASASSSRRS